jgi:hypothetical protein
MRPYHLPNRALGPSCYHWLCHTSGMLAPAPPAIIKDDSSTSGPLPLSPLPALDNHELYPTFYSPVPKQAPRPCPIPTLAADPPPSRLLLSLSQEEVIQLVHCPGSSPPQVQSCDWANGLDTKIHRTSEELHRALGCGRFQNYKHIL